MKIPQFDWLFWWHNHLDKNYKTVDVIKNLEISSCKSSKYENIQKNIQIISESWKNVINWGGGGNYKEEADWIEQQLANITKKFQSMESLYDVVIENCI